MYIVGANFSVVVRMRSDGVITQADRAVRYLEGRRIGDVLALAAKRGWQIKFNDHEQVQLANLESASTQPMAG